jgi:hypothetical protein
LTKLRGGDNIGDFFTLLTKNMPIKPLIASSLALAGAALAISTATPAHALTFTWSFVTGDSSTGGGGQTISGTISGLVEGNNDGTGLTITVDSTPTGELTGGGWTFVEAFLGGPAFTVTGGVVTFADAFYSSSTVVGSNNAALFFGGFGGFVPELSDSNDFDPFWLSFSPNTFTPVSTPTVPEPGSVVALLGLGALSIAGRKLRK